MKTICKLVGYIVTIGTGAIICNLIYRYGPAVSFWIGFICGMIFLFALCGIIVMLQPDKTAAGASNFFLEYRTKLMHKRIAKRNAAIGLFVLVLFTGCQRRRYDSYECQHHVISYSLGYWQSAMSDTMRQPYYKINQRFKRDSAAYVKQYCQ